MFTSKDWASFLTAIVVGMLAALALVIGLRTIGSVQVGVHTAWYAGRAAGIIAYLLATGSVLLGMATSTKLGTRMVGKANVADLHRVFSLLTVITIGLHIFFLALDQYAKFTLKDLLIPFATWYRPVFTGFGIIAAYLAVAIYLSFYLRSKIGYKAWRAFHYSSFAVFFLGTVHGFFAGTDSVSSWAVLMYAAAAMSVWVMLIYRMSAQPATSAAPPAGPINSAAAGTDDARRASAPPLTSAAYRDAVRDEAARREPGGHGRMSRYYER